MTLNQTWKNCIRMWEWIVEQTEKGHEYSVDDLKGQWLQDHGFNYINSNCFFCKYDVG